MIDITAGGQLIFNCISRKRKKVKKSWNKTETKFDEKLSKKRNRITTFESEIVITGSKVWIKFSCFYTGVYRNQIATYEVEKACFKTIVQNGEINVLDIPEEITGISMSKDNRGNYVIEYNYEHLELISITNKHIKVTLHLRDK